MQGVAIILASILVLGFAFLSVANSGRPTLQRTGPWLVGAAAWVIGTLVLSTYDDGVAVLLPPFRQHQLRAIFLTSCVLALLASEAVFISRWAITRLSSRSGYLAFFACATLFAWFLTFLALWDVIPSS
jgi:hypothetical protein